MSRSNPTETLVNPAKLFIEWSGSEGKFKYYDKEKKENVFLDLPVKFIPLDRLSTVKGWSDAEKKGYWANEVRSTKDDVLTVRSKDGVELVAKYEVVKEKMSAKGVDYVQSLYAAMKIGKELCIVNFQLKGSGLTPFIEFAKGKKIEEIGVQVLDVKPCKKGATKYFEPVYSIMDVSEATNKLATELDVELQDYLNAYLAKNKSNVQQPTVTENQENGLNQMQLPKSEAPVKVESDLSVPNSGLISALDEESDMPF
jgi:hypothetical protein